jgi:tetratricopeptide (TPR) repeat protein
MGYQTEQERLLCKYEASKKQEDFDELLVYMKPALDNGSETADDIGMLAYAYDMQANIYTDKAIELYNKYLDMRKGAKDRRYYKNGRQLINILSRNGRNHENIEKYKGLIQEFPGDTEMYVALALSYKLAHQYDEAWEVIQAGLKLDNKKFSLLSYAGDVCKALGKYDDALKYWDMAGEEFIDCLYSKALLCTELGQKDNAIKTWERVIAWLEEKGFIYEAEWAKKELSKLKNG